jgi:uncharacterized protein YgbK (DUF1537 family)
MIGVIADDLTGAAELGALGWRLGLQTEVQFAGESVHDAELVCVDTDSRSCDEKEAAARAAAVARTLLQAGATFIYKKVDSVLRGQVTAEVEAILQQAGLSLALLIPANPALGRIISNGHYFVDGRSLEQTEFSADPQYPRRSRAVRELIAAPTTVPLHTGTPKDPLPHSGIVLGDAVNAADLQSWAGKRTPRILPAGGVEFFGAILASTLGLPSCPGKIRPVHQPAARELFVCGTTSRSSLEFIRIAREQQTPVFGLPPELAGGEDWERARLQDLASQAAAAFSACSRIIVTIGLPAMKDRSVSQRLHQRLATLAHAIWSQTACDHIYAEGGATAREVLRQMGWTRMKVLGEAGPGIATLGSANDAGPRITMKPGSYVWPQTISRLKPSLSRG